MKPFVGGDGRLVACPDKATSRYLEEAATRYTEGRSAYNRGIILAAHSLRRFVMAWLEYGDDMPEDRRLKLSVCRETAIQCAARRVKISTTKIREMLAMSAAINLLSDDGDTGGLTYFALRAFCKTVERHLVGKRIVPASAMKPNCIKLSDTEQWRLVPEYAKNARRVYTRAVKESWVCREIETALGIPKLSSKKIHDTARVPDLYGEVLTASPNDLAEMILAMINRSRHPGWVKKVLLSRLQHSVEEPAPDIADMIVIAHADRLDRILSEA